MNTLNELFEITNGCAILKRELLTQKTDDCIQVVGASGELQATVIGYIAQNQVEKIFAKDTIYVSTNGAGCCTAFVSPVQFTANADVAVLIPKQTMTLMEKIFYTYVINLNKYKFSYGRKPKGDRLGNIQVPSIDEIPDWVYTTEIPSFDNISEAKTQDKVELPPNDQWKTYTYDDLFNIQKVTGPKISEIKKTVGNVPYVSATAENNGVAYYGDFEATTKGNCLTVGHLGDCFYQPQDFAGSNVTVLIPKFELTKELGMFLSTLINANKYKYCYGRVIGISRLKEETISLPVTEQGEPDWDLMERYINSLPYSKYL